MTANAQVSKPASNLALAPKHSPHQPSQWHKARWHSASALPQVVQEIYPALHQDEIHVVGGISNCYGLPCFTNTHWIYQAQTDAWRAGHRLPVDCHHAALVSSDWGLLLVGGFHGGYTHIWRMSEQVLRLTPSGWERLADLPQAQAEGVLGKDSKGALHLVTGIRRVGEGNRSRSDHTETTQHWVKQGEHAAWEVAAPIPTARNSACGGWLDGRWVIAGGRTAKGNLAQTEVYDPQSDKWRSVRPMPLAQAGAAAAVIDNKLMVFGGENFVPQSQVFANAWCYDLRSDTWEALPDMPVPRHGLGAVTLNQQVHVFAGAAKAGGWGTSALHWRLSPPNITATE